MQLHQIALEEASAWRNYCSCYRSLSQEIVSELSDLWFTLPTLVSRHQMFTPVHAIVIVACLIVAPSGLSPQSTVGGKSSRPDSITESGVALDLGHRAFDAKTFLAASEAFERATILNPKSAEAFLWLGNAYARQALEASMVRKVILGPKAKAAWERAVALDPKNFEAHENLLDYYDMVPKFLGGGRDKAFDEARVLQSIEPYRGGVLLGALAEKDGDFAAAKLAYSVAARFPADTSAKAFDGWIYALHELKLYDEAFRAIDARLSQVPNDVIALGYLARTAVQSGQRTDDGMTAAVQGDRSPLPPSFRFASSAFAIWRGRLLERKGDLAGAAAVYRAAAERSPSDKLVRESLKRVTLPP